MALHFFERRPTLLAFSIACQAGEKIRGSARLDLLAPPLLVQYPGGRSDIMLTPFARDLQPQVVMPLNAAAYCADCEAVFDGRNRQSCVACASSVIVPVSCLIDKSSLLAQPWSPRAATPDAEPMRSKPGEERRRA